MNSKLSEYILTTLAVIFIFSIIVMITIAVEKNRKLVTEQEVKQVKALITKITNSKPALICASKRIDEYTLSIKNKVIADTNGNIYNLLYCKTF